MPILTTQYNDLAKNALVQWEEGYAEVPRAARQLYKMSSTEVMTSEHSHIDPPPFARRKAEGAAYVIGSPKQGYSLTLTQARIGLRDSVTWEMRKFDKYDQIMAKMRGLGESTARRIEMDLTHFFTFGMTASSYTNADGETVNTVTGDGVALFSNSHTITGDSSVSLDNLNGTTTFGRAGLEAAERLACNMVNMQNEKRTPSMTHIITSDDPEIKNAVREFMGSDKAPDTSENAKNVYRGKYTHVPLSFLATDANGAPSSTGRYYWMLADLAHTSAKAEFSEFPTFVAALPGNNGDEFDTDDWSFKSAATYAYGVLDPKWIIGSAATSV